MSFGHDMPRLSGMARRTPAGGAAWRSRREGIRKVVQPPRADVTPEQLQQLSQVIAKAFEYRPSG